MHVEPGYGQYLLRYELFVVWMSSDIKVFTVEGDGPGGRYDFNYVESDLNEITSTVSHPQ